MKRSRLGLTRNDGRKSCKVILLYIIFCRVITYFKFVGFFIFFILFKGKTPLSGARLGQCQLDSVINEVKDIVFPGKAHLSLGRVDIDIHKVSGHFQKQDSSRELALHRGAFERCFHGRHHGAVADIAPIDVEILHTAAGAAAPGLGDEAPHPVHPFLIVQLHEVTAEFPAQHRVGGTAQLAVTGGDILQLTLPDKLEADLRVAQGHMGHDIRHKGTLAGILFEELHPGRGVVEQILHPDGSAHTACTGLQRIILAALDAVDRGALVVLSTGQYFYPRHAGNGSQRFSTEAQGVDMVQIILRPDLTGGVADECRGDILCFNARAIIADLDQLHAA